jgi:hypothetical protein
MNYIESERPGFTPTPKANNISIYFKIIFNDIYVVNAVQCESYVTALLEQLDVCFISRNVGSFLNDMFHIQNEKIMCKYGLIDCNWVQNLTAPMHLGLK